MDPIKTILVPIDFGEPSEAALAQGAELAERLGAKLVLLHAYELPIVSFPDGAVVATAELANRIVAAAQKAIADAVAKLAGRKIEVQKILRQGDAREVILAVTKEVGANIVVMGTHGRRGIARALIGSVTESVVRTSAVPVLTVHADEAPAAA